MNNDAHQTVEPLVIQGKELSEYFVAPDYRPLRLLGPWSPLTNLQSARRHHGTEPRIGHNVVAKVHWSPCKEWAGWQISNPTSGLPELATGLRKGLDVEELKAEIDAVLKRAGFILRGTNEADSIIETLKKDPRKSYANERHARLRHLIAIGHGPTLPPTCFCGASVEEYGQMCRPHWEQRWGSKK